MPIEVPSFVEMAEVIISIVAKVSEYLVNPVKREGYYLFCANKIYKNLEKEKVKLTSTRDDVSQRAKEAEKKTERIEDAVKNWLQEVQSRLTEVENLEQEVKSNNNCSRGWYPTWRRYHLCKKLAKKTKIMKELNINSKFEPFSRLAPLPNIEYFSSGNFAFFVSTKLAYNKLLEAIQDDNTYMIGLHGMGGSGKTTLVKEVGKRAKELKYFDQVVLLTTRRQQVCTTMDCQRKIPLDLLTEDETWTLFQKYAGIGNDDFLFLHGVAREVAGECKGLPIAIVAVGTTLKGKSTDEWKVALKRLRDSKPIDVEEGMKDAFSCLQLSYDYLRSREAKSLLLICSMFPEDYEICIEDLFRYGIGLGLCGEVSSFEVARSEVNASINNLIDSCLLMRSEKRNNHLKMHDVIRDVALWIASKEEKSIVVNPTINLSAFAGEESIKKSYALSSWYKDIDQFPNKLNAPKLEILLVDSKTSLQLSSSSFKSMKSLKVVAMIAQHYYMGRSTSLLLSTQHLTNLRTLRLVRWELGDISSVLSLGQLEILDLRGSCFKELPNGLEKLDKLKLLDLSWCGIEVSCYKVLRRCSQLQELYVSGDTHGIGIIDACECFKDDITFTKIQSYELQIGQFQSDMSLDLEDLSTRVLRIGELNPVAAGAFIKCLLQRAGDVSFYKLCGGDCKSIVPCMIQAIGCMKELNNLLLHSCSEIECLIDTTSDDVLFRADTVFPRLMKLQLQFMNNLKEVCHGPPLPHFFEKLEKLLIWRCLRLHSLFSGEWNLCNLKVVSISDCPKLTSLFQMSAAQTLHQLEELTIAKCSELMSIILNAENGTSTGEEISPSQDNSSLAFPKLKILSVCYCHKLEYIFPISCVESLKKLQHLSIVEASELKYIFGQHDHGDHFSLQNEIHIEFPLLEVLELEALTNLVGICPKNYQTSFPSLREEYCVGCPKFTNVGSALRQLLMVQFHSLIYALLFKNIIVLGDGTHDSQSSIEVAILSQILEDIKNGRVANASNLQGGFDKEQQEAMVSALSQILDNVKNSGAADNSHLQTAGLEKDQQEAVASALAKVQSGTLSEPTETLSLQHPSILQVIKVTNFKSLKFLFSPVIHKSLSELRQLHIYDCEELEGIIAENEETQAEVCFPKLRELRVMRCNKLKHLFSATTTITLPQLNSLCISEAAQLEVVLRQKSEDGFTLHTLEIRKVLIHDCPRLDPIIGATQVSSDHRTEEMQPPVTEKGKAACNADSNLLADSNAIKQFPIDEEQEKIMTSNVEWLYLKHLPDPIFIWINFQNIYFLQLRGCKSLKSIFPANVIRSMPRLSLLDIGDCDELEEIISDPDIEEPPFGNPISNIRPQKVCFPNLTDLIVQRCRKLKCLFSVTKRTSSETYDGELIEFVLPKLRDLVLNKLPCLIDICGGFQYQFQLQLQALKSYDVNHCPNFSSTTMAMLDNFWRARQSHSTENLVFLVPQCELFHESGVAELVLAMATGWNTQLIVEIASHHLCIVPMIGEDQSTSKEWARRLEGLLESAQAREIKQ
ncbi:putative disease resistance protein [Senna tora]|uniref:Putative disease resistance protein n=1 Tax=Senna tora TaxID=362788 RepID=A0A834WDU5_9FABA|nr:putative disease resistance protein [Senna tora]